MPLYLHVASDSGIFLWYLVLHTGPDLLFFITVFVLDLELCVYVRRFGTHGGGLGTKPAFDELAPGYRQGLPQVWADGFLVAPDCYMS